MAEYNKWLEETGYSEIRSRRDALVEERKKLMNDLKASYEREQLDAEQKAIEK